MLDSHRDVDDSPTAPVGAWFLGPKAENGEQWQSLFAYVLADYIHWRRNHFTDDPVTITHTERHTAAYQEWTEDLTGKLDQVLSRLKTHFPFYSPHYIAHMLSEQTLPSLLGYFAAMLYNPNNVTGEAAPVTVDMELEVGRMVASMIGYDPSRAWAHISSGGTVANLEALWVARMVQFVPFMVREYCRNQLPFTIKTPTMEWARIGDLDDWQLLSLRPQESIGMLRRLAKYLVEDGRAEPDEAQRVIATLLDESLYNPKRQGFSNVLRRVSLTPRLLVSASAHYSILKAADVLGYGESGVIKIPVTSRFRIDMDQLREVLFNLSPHDYVAAVVAVAGTTEEGAVDPVHRIKFLREDLCREQNRSFWLHVDAAWGGYIACLFRGHTEMDQRLRDPFLADVLDNTAADMRLDRSYHAMCKALNLEEHAVIDFGAIRDGGQRYKGIEIKWNDPEVYKAFLALKTADSITVDPHKLGFVPYPAGVIAFQHGGVAELMRQKAQYIAAAHADGPPMSGRGTIEAIGPFILEGSKPGAAAASCWLAHSAIPLTYDGHGAIIKDTLMSAKRLTRYLRHHRHLTDLLDPPGSPPASFTFMPIYEPDTNIVCFILVLTQRNEGVVTPRRVKLATLNRVNENLYSHLSITDVKHQGRLSYGQEFYVSRTVLMDEQYSATSLERLLTTVDVSSEEYAREGLFVLRSTVMNPFYGQSIRQGHDYLFHFLRHLHLTAHATLVQLRDEVASAITTP